jgi:hypothetical protein
MGVVPNKLHRVVYTTAMDLLVGNRAAAEHVGVKPDTWSAYVSRGEAPRPTARHIDEKTGHALPVWSVADVDAWKAERPGVGAPGRARAKRKAAP